MPGEARWLFLGVWKVGRENLKVFGVTKDYFNSLTVIRVFIAFPSVVSNVFPKVGKLRHKASAPNHSFLLEKSHLRLFYFASFSQSGFGISCLKELVLK